MVGKGGGSWPSIPQYHHDSFQRALRRDAVNEAKEFEYEPRAGMTPMQAIQTATRNAAGLERGAPVNLPPCRPV